MRGGTRPGAGRKPSEPTIRIRVPVGALPMVKRALELYKKSVPQINEAESSGNIDVQKVGSEIKEPSLIKDPEIDRFAEQERQAFFDRRKALERLPKHAQKAIRRRYGSLVEAARLGVRVVGDEVIGP